jgi:hypothetical protein
METCTYNLVTLRSDNWSARRGNLVFNIYVPSEEDRSGSAAVQVRLLGPSCLFFLPSMEGAKCQVWSLV